MIQPCYLPDTRRSYLAARDELAWELWIMMRNRRLGGLLAVAGLAAVGITALPGEANAWWRGGWCCGVGIGVVYYAPPQQAWIPPHWQGNVWVPGHWS